MKNTLVTIVLAGLVSGAVFAEGGKGGMGMGAGTGMGMESGQSRDHMQTTREQRFQEIDGDRDGYVSREEAENHQRLTNNWEKADANSDGKLDASEFSAMEGMTPPEPVR